MAAASFFTGLPSGPSYLLPQPVKTATQNTTNRKIQCSVDIAMDTGLITEIKSYSAAALSTHDTAIKIKELVTGIITGSVLAKPSNKFALLYG